MKLPKDANKITSVYSTTDYSYFKKMIGNRDVEKYSILKQRIEESGQIAPIVINEDREVIDGQHRLAILKELGYPVKFIISTGADFLSVISMNTAQKNWKPIDYVNAYADRGNVDYIKIREFLYSHKHLNISLILSAVSGKRHGTYSVHVDPKLKSGELKASNMLQLERFAEFYEKVLDETILKDHHALQSTLWTLYTIKNFDEKRLLQKVKSPGISKRINLYKSASDILRELVMAYNSNISDKNPKYIEYYYNAKGALILPEKNME